MDWLNPPPAWEERDGALTVTTAPRTDFWRRTHYGFVRDNGHVYAREVTGDFVAEVKVTGAYRDLYDQAGLMVRVDETTWLKCGIELVDGVQQASVVVTRDWSDWSVVPLASNPPSIWLRVTRRGEDVEIHVSLDGARFDLIRVAHLSPAQTVQVGPMCASPEGNGFEVGFDGFAVRTAEES